MAGDAAAAILVEIAKKFIQPAIDATFLHCGYLINSNSNINNLKQRAEDLKSKRLDAKSFFDSMANNNQERTKAGDDWLIKTEAAEKATDGIMKDFENLKTGCCRPNPIKRYRLSKKAVMEAARIHQLEIAGKDYLSPSIPALPSAKLTGAMANNLSDDYKSRASIMKKIMEALKDDKVSIIAVCGSGGVGKTTLMHELRERVKVDGLFKEVAMVVVSQTPDILDIQRKLAEMLGLTDLKDVTNKIGRADAIYKRLTGKERKTLVILDDIWDEINLAELGIPVRSDHPQCKVVLTSRDTGICTLMNSQKIIPVTTMPPNEAWNLFKKKAGNYVESDDLKKIAEEVAQECGGLPIALVTVAGALHDKKAKEIWRDALKQLKDHRVTTIEGMERKVYLSIKLSYDFLAREVPEAKLLLLLCCQHPEDAEIEMEKLARYCLALRLFENVEMLCDIRNRVTSLMEHLKGRFLVEAVDVDDHDKKLGLDRVKMHDIVRYVGCSIVSSSNEERDGVYMHMYNGKKEINGGYEVGASDADYKKIKILVHSEKGGPMERSFLSKMDELRVLECYLAYNNVDVGVEDLTKLRMLSIETYKSGEMWSKMGRLTELEILHYNNSRCPSALMFPHQLKQLTHLKLLDLRCRGETLVPITRGILSELKKLEMLYLGVFYFTIEPGESEASITELSMLPNLMSLQVPLLSPMQLLQLPIEKLERFYFFVTPRSEVYQLRYRKPLIWRRLDVVGSRMDLILGDKIGFILRMTEELKLRNLDWTDGSWIGLFTKLEYLKLVDMKELTTLCQNGNFLLGTFGNLKRLLLRNLPKLRHFLVGLTDPLCLKQLQELIVQNCDMLEGITSKGDGKATGGEVGEIKEERATDFILHFPNLRKVGIEAARRFRGFYNIHDKDSLVQPLVHSLVMLPSLEELYVSDLDQLKQIVAGRNTYFPKYVTSDWLQNLQELLVDSCKSLESVFDFEVMQLMAEHERVVTLVKLRSILLMRLPNLTCIFRCRMQNISIPQLQTIEVFGCNKLRNLVVSNLIKQLQSLKKVKIEDCETIQAVFDFEGLEVMSKDSNVILGELQQVEVENLPKLEHICRLPPKEVSVFQNLTILDVTTCDTLTYLISSSVAQSLVNLESLCIMYCKSMEVCIRMEEKDYSGEQIVFRSLKSIELKRLENLSSFCASDLQVFEFPSLERLIIIDCPELKTFCGGLMTADKLHGVEFVEGKPVWLNNLNETVRHFNTSDKKEAVVSDGNADNLNDILCNNEGTSLASSSIPALNDNILSGSTELHVSSRNDNPKEDDLVAAVNNVSQYGDGYENTQATPASVETNASPPSEIFLKEALPFTDTSMQTKAEKELFDSVSNSPDDDQKQSEFLIPGADVESKLRTKVEEIPKEEQTSSRDVTLSSIKAKQPLLPTYIQASTSTPTHQITSREENKAELQELKKKVNEITSQIGSHGSKLESIDITHLTSLVSQLITSQQALQTQLCRLLHTEVSTIEGEDTVNKADLQELKKKVDENTAQIRSHGSKLESIDAHLAALKSLMDTMVEEIKKKR